MALNIVSDMSAADLKNVKSYRHFSCVVRQFVSVVEIPIKYPRLYHKINFSTFEFSLFDLSHFVIYSPVWRFCTM